MSPVPYARTARPEVRKLLADASAVPYWLDSPRRPAASDPLAGADRADLLVVGGGFTGLWTALLAVEEDPDREVVLVEGSRIGWAATGRNGGFCAASVTHGFFNGVARWPEDMALLTELGRTNLEGIAATIERYGIDASFERTGELDVATEDYQVEEFAAAPAQAAAYGEHLELLDADELRERVRSPLYRAGLLDRDGCAIVDPARLAWGLRDAALAHGVRIHERTRAVSLGDDPAGGAGVAVRTDGDDGPGQVVAEHVALATNAFPPLLRRLRHYLVPVYDYVLVTEPLADDVWAEIGWQGREGIGDAGNQFHYSRPTVDGRILYGGYDAVYHPRVSTRHDQRPESFELLAEHLLATYPVLEGVRFSHAWGGAIDTCSRFAPFMGTARSGRVAYAAGYTGLGVGASRFGAAVMLDLLAGRRTGRTENAMVSSMPVPFPPEPFRRAGIELTRWSLDRADQRAGRRNLWLRTLDRLGLGFDS